MAGLPKGEEAGARTAEHRQQELLFWVGLSLGLASLYLRVRVTFLVFKYKDFIKVTLPAFGHGFGKRIGHA